MLIESMGVIGGFLTPVLSLDMQGYCVYSSYTSGQSSLERLYNHPYSELKVDKSFVMDAMKSDKAAKIVRSTVDLGHSLGLKVAAEGKEDQPTLDWLFELGCDLAQGFHISPPLDVLGFGSWMEQWQQNKAKLVDYQGRLSSCSC